MTASLLTRPGNVQQIKICLRHRENLGISGKQPPAKCSIPGIMSLHSAKKQKGLSIVGT